MAKFHHSFKLFKESPIGCIYTCGETSAQIDFVSDSCVRVAVYKDADRMLPTFSINPENTVLPKPRHRLCTDGFSLFAPQITNTANGAQFDLPNNRKIVLNTENFLLQYYQNDALLFADRAPLAYNFENEFGKETYHYLTRSPEERIFGLGDKAGSLDKAGKAFRIETADAMGYNAKQSDPLYKHIPFYICENAVGCYGIFYDTSDTSYMDFGKEINNYYPPYKYFKTEDDCLVYYVFFGTKLSVLQQFARLCGKQAFPPNYSFEYCASTMAYTDAPRSQEKMEAFLRKLQETDLSCGGFYLSSGYTSIGTQRYVFHWNREKFPDPQDFIQNFHENGITVIPNIKPAFLTSHPLYKTVADNGWFVKNPDGTPFVTEFWDGLGSYLDFTNPGAFIFWKHQVTEKLLNYGITATWNDNNEFDIRDCDAVAVGFGNGTVAAHRIRPLLTYLMVSASYAAQAEKNPQLRPFLSTRSGNIAVRRLAQTWSGDNTTSFEDLRYCHYIGLTMSLSGLYFYGHDLGGFHGEMPSRELLLRWLQHGIFEPRFTIHSWNSDGSATMPWSYPDCTDTVHALFTQRKRLLPYIYNCAYQAVAHELPLNAPPFLYYDDEALYQYPDEMMLGQDILAAFVFDEGETSANVYLPKGADWYLDAQLYTGGQVVSLSLPPNAPMPYFVRGGSVLPTDEAPYGFLTAEQLTFTVYPVKSGTFTNEFFTDDGISFRYLQNDCVHLQFTVVCTESTVQVTYENTGNTAFTPQIRLCAGDGRRLDVIGER